MAKIRAKAVKIEHHECVERTEGVYRDEDGALVVPTKDILQIFDVTKEQLSDDWIGKWGCPKKARNEFRICDVYQWRNTADMGKEMSAEAKKLRADADYKEAKARQEEVRLKEMLGELVDLEILKGELSTIFTNIRQMLLKLPSDVRVHVNTLYPESAAGISEIVDESVRKALEELARCGYSPAESKVAAKSKKNNKSGVRTLRSAAKADGK